MSLIKQLAAELAEHRRLRDEGIISQAVYLKAKKSIFLNHGDHTLTKKY